MDKSPDAFRTISEVAEWLGVQAHVLRFWESKFAQVKPVKRAGGRRYYRPADMLLLGGIKKLLHEDGLTVKGTQKILREQGVAHVSDLSQELCDVAADTAQKMAEEAKVVPFKGETGAPEVGGILTDRATTQGTPPAEVALVSDLPVEDARVASADRGVEKGSEAPAEKAAEAPPAEIPVEMVAGKVAGKVPETPAEAPAATPAEIPAEVPAEIPTEIPAETPTQTATIPATETPAAETLAESPAESPAETPPVQVGEEQPMLPSFLHRPAAVTASPSDDKPEPAPEPVAPAKPSLVVDAPDPPQENDLPYAQGTLAHLSRINSLNAAQAARIAPLAKELQGWLDRTRGAGAS